MKLILAVIGKLKENDKDFKDYIFSIKDFFGMSDEVEGNYGFIRESIKGILSKPLEIKTEKGLLQCNWLSGATSTKALVKLRFDPELKPYLLQLKQQFTTLKLEYLLKLQSIYSIRVYELLKQFEKLGFREMELDDLRWILEIPNSYKISNIRIILDKAREEIGQKTDISFTYKFEKFGAKFGWIRFTIRNKKNKEENKIEGKEEDVERASLQELADKCFKEENCENIKITMPYCKVCENYSKKVKRG